MYTLNKTDNSFTEDASDSVFGSAIKGFTGIFKSDDDTALSATEVRWGTVALTGANVIATSMFTRSRVKKGQKPMAGIIF